MHGEFLIKSPRENEVCRISRLASNCVVVVSAFGISRRGADRVRPAANARRSHQTGRWALQLTAHCGARRGSCSKECEEKRKIWTIA
jgi:hypothetical protein